MTDNAPLGPGYVLGGRYRLTQRLGRGGMSTVWQAVDEVLGRDVAVKIVAETEDAEITAERFRREAQATAALNHPNIVTVFDAGVDADRAFLVMELLPGRTLADELRTRGAFPVQEVRDIAVQVTGALEAAHQAGLVHRDIKPGNIARTADGGVKVVDFGISHIIDEAMADTHDPLTATGTVIGTAAYLAPEQGRGERVDQRADLYSLGCVLYALLSGKPPFQGPTAVSTMLQHATDPVPDLREARPEVPRELAAVVHTLLAKEPEARPQSAAAVGAAIQAETAQAVTELLPAPVGEDTTTVPASELPAPTRARAAGAPDPLEPMATPTRAVDAGPIPDDHEPAALLPMQEEEEGGRRGVLIALVAATLAVLAGFTWWLFSGNPNLTTQPDPTAVVPATESPTPTLSPLAPEPTPLQPTFTDTAGLGSPTPLAEPTIADQPVEEPAPETAEPVTQAPPPPSPPPATTAAPPPPPPATQAPPPATQAPPGRSGDVGQAAQAVQAAADQLSRAVQDATTGGGMDNRYRKEIDAGLRDLAKALRNQDEDAADKALDRIDDALGDSGYEDQFKGLFDQLKDLVDDWDDLV